MAASVSPTSSRRKAAFGNASLVFAAGIACGFLAGVNYSGGPASLSLSWALLLPEEEAPKDGGAVPTPSSRAHAPSNSVSISSSISGYGGTVPSEGWKTLHVFYGTADHLQSASMIQPRPFANKKYFGGAEQDRVVVQLFREKRGGYFLDLAAHDAVLDSNTYVLETRYGWSGICVDAAAKFWLGLSYRSCHVVGAVVGNDREDVTFVHRTEPGLSGIVGDGFDNKVVKKGVAETRRTVALEEVFRRFDAPRVIDYFSFDVEGAEDMVLQPSVLLQYRFNVLTIERPKQALKDLLVTHGYVFLKEISKFGETLWAHSLALPELDLVGAGIEKPPVQ
jgi:Methyltransferase FkbM domain